MPVTTDRMQDVFPITFEFAGGERPASTKFSKWSKLTDLAFANAVAVVGDPLDYSTHTNGSSNQYWLSWGPLSQANLARFSGPSSMVSPGGSSLSQTMSTFTVTLASGQNTWSLGFPLIKKQTSTYVFQPDSAATDVASLDLDTDISFVGSPTQFTTRKSILSDVDADGDYYIDYKTGVITTYDVTTATVTVSISNLHFLGAGAPWGTHNVIPDWTAGSTSGVSVVYVSDAGGEYTYDITLPTISHLPRVGDPATLRGSSDSSEVSGTVVPGEGARYEIPSFIRSGWNSSGGITGDSIPEGFMYLWDNDTQSIIPLTTFTLKSTSYELTLTCGELSGVSTSGTPNTSRYRIITVGSSLSDTVSYMAAVMRDNSHVGLTDGASIKKTLTYTPPIKHSDLTELFSIHSTVPSGWEDALKFKESYYPTNEHPQYLHRGGYMVSDIDGNTANAMRGDFVLGGVLAASSAVTYSVGTSSATIAAIAKTAAVSFGAGLTTDRNNDSAWLLRFQGTNAEDTWSSGRPHRAPFGLVGTGSGLPVSTTYDYQYQGYLNASPWKGTPLYLRGHIPTTSSLEDRCGAVLGFDLGRFGEANYIRLVEGYRSDTTYDYANIPANTPSQTSWSTALGFTPQLSNRLLAEQVREFRFRGVPYISTATNTSDSIGGSGLRGAGAISEYQHHFTSPGMVGCDFLNVYSNAIFFSDTGDGKLTSFTSNADDWLNSADSRYVPSGVYYYPDSTNPYINFAFHVPSVPNTYGSFSVGPGFLSWIDRLGTTAISASSGGNIGITSTQNVSVTAGYDINLTSSDDIVLNAPFTSGHGVTLTGYLLDFNAVNIDIDATSNINIDAAQDLQLGANTGDVDITASGGKVDINASNAIELDSTNITATDNAFSVDISSGSGDITFELDNVVSDFVIDSLPTITGQSANLYIDPSTKKLYRII